jgi:Zn-dependent protease
MENMIAKISVMLIPGLLAVMLHEVAHGYVAEKLGDPTARMLGRLTFNPFKHIDPFGLLMLFLIGFGWARPVPVNPLNFKRPRQDMVWVALAGPLSNLLLAGLSGGCLYLLGRMAPGAVGTPGRMIFEPLTLMAGFSLYINLVLAVLNLIPVPPLDGGRVVVGVLPEVQARLLSRVEPFGFFIVIVLIFFTPLWGRVLLPLVASGVNLLAGPQAGVVHRVMQFLFSS